MSGWRFRALGSAVTIISAIVCILGAEPGPAGPALQRFTVAVNGHSFAVWARVPEAPKGAILLLHGRTWSSLPDFDLQVAGQNRSVLSSIAAKGFAAYALDQRGYGETPRDRTGWISPRQAADDAAGVMAWIAARHPSLRKPALLGWSLGAATAHMVAAERQAALSAVILYGYAPDPGSVILPVSEPVRPARERNSPEAAASDFIVPEMTDPAIVHAFIEKAMQTDPIHVDWRDEEQFLCDPSGIKAPTLILFGERDPNVDADGALQFSQHLGTNEKQIMVLPGADHCAHLESTHEAWIAAVVNFLNRPGGFAR